MYTPNPHTHLHAQPPPFSCWQSSSSSSSCCCCSSSNPSKGADAGEIEAGGRKEGGVGQATLKDPSNKGTVTAGFTWAFTPSPVVVSAGFTGAIAASAVERAEGGREDTDAGRMAELIVAGPTLLEA